MNKTVVSIGYTAIFLTALSGIWGMDIAVGALTINGQVVVYGGTIPTLDFYHFNLIKLMLAIFSIFVISMYLILGKGESSEKSKGKYQKEY